MAISQSEYDKLRGVKSNTSDNDIGIATSMFTAIVITKYIVFLYSKKKDINSVFLQG